MCVRCDNLVSHIINVSNGARQGVILSPYLFCVYMELSTVLNGYNVGCYVVYICVNNMYADDLVVLCPSSRGRQTLLTICDQYGFPHNINYNSKKSMVLIMRNKSCKNVQFPSFMLNNEMLLEAEFVKYLGHLISNSMLDKCDISRHGQGDMLIRKCHMCSNDVKKTLFTTFCSPMYIAHIGWNFHNHAIRKLYVSYNNVCIANGARIRQIL